MLKNSKRLLILFLLLMVAGCGGGSAPSTSSAALVSIALDPTNPRLAVGASEQFTATGTYSDSTTRDLTSFVTWDSSETGVAMVGKYGMATPVAAGTTLITARLGDISGMTHVTVTPATLVAIVVGPANPSIPIGLTERLTAVGAYSDGAIRDLTNSVAWNSSNTSIATCDATGKVTSVAVGTSELTATLDGITGSTTVTATSATLLSITVSPVNPSVAIGFTEQFTAIGTYSDTTTHDLTSMVTWSTSNAAVAGCSLSGLATSVATGSTTITAAMTIDQPVAGTISGSTTLTVTAETLLAIIVTPINASAPLGITQQFSATGVFSDSTRRDLTSVVTWSSSDEFVSAVSNASASKGIATPVNVGSTAITATMVVAQPLDGTISGSTAFTVTPEALISIMVTPINPSTDLGEELQFTATGIYTDYSTTDLTAWVTWSSSDTEIAVIGNLGSNGKATPVAVGSTTIIAEMDGLASSTTLTVTPVPIADPINGAALYAANCAACHGSLEISYIWGATAAQIKAMINSGGGGMSTLSFLTPAQIRDIGAALADTD